MEFNKTVSQVAAEVPASAGTVRAYADSGLVESIRVGTGGVRMFRADAAGKVREILRQHLAKKGRHARA